MAAENLELYRHLFDETLFLVPEPGLAEAQRAAAPAPVAEEPVSGDTPTTPRYPLLGENRQGLIIVVSLPEKDFQALPGNEFLFKVLSAIRRTPADVGFVNIPRGEKLRLFELEKETQVRQLVAFGSGLIDMSADSKVHLYMPAAIGRVALLLGDPVADIEVDVTKKKLLWSGLQAIFLK